MRDHEVCSLCPLLPALLCQDVALGVVDLLSDAAVAAAGRLVGDDSLEGKGGAHSRRALHQGAEEGGQSTDEAPASGVQTLEGDLEAQEHNAGMGVPGRSRRSSDSREGRGDDCDKRPRRPLIEEL